MNSLTEEDVNFNKRQLKRIFYRRLAVVIWVSFLVAAVETMVFFVIFDPQLLGQLSTWSVMLEATQGYTFGFIFFWIFNLITAFLVGIIMVLPRTKLAKRTIPKAE
ncbi:hypothetical protein MNBD_GAMMA01-547 [hydrothermal vent metagenome]|uniref:Uncharacterized protein n=1 Tax=hydrothermal vent metagenome TaxID=652676 RepID=A0A3B0W868_9ZZZZ